VFERLQKDQKKENAVEEAMEEFEDDQGNVFNKKTYEGIVFYKDIYSFIDLKRQGLL
jgi:hypothetical protein